MHVAMQISIFLMILFSLLAYKFCEDFWVEGSCGVGIKTPQEEEEEQGQEEERV